MEHVITVEHLNKRYRDTVAVEDVSFSVRRGEIFGMLGPNGAGKTTTIECLQGLRSRQAGRVEVLGMDPESEQSHLRSRIGSQLQSSALPERLRVAEAIGLSSPMFRPRRSTSIGPWPPGISPGWPDARTAPSPVGSGNGCSWPSPCSATPNWFSSTS